MDIRELRDRERALHTPLFHGILKTALPLLTQSIFLPILGEWIIAEFHNTKFFNR